MFLNRHTDPEDSSGRGNESESTSKKRTRGINKMGDLILARKQRRKIYVEFNENNQVIEKFEKKMMSYLGCVARHYVPIDILDWREVSKEMKNKI